MYSSRTPTVSIVTNCIPGSPSEVFADIGGSISMSSSEVFADVGGSISIWPGSSSEVFPDAGGSTSGDGEGTVKQNLNPDYSLVAAEKYT